MHQPIDNDVGVPQHDRGPWFQTYSGVRFHFLDPRPEDILPEDLALGLGQQCRFTGQIGTFYSIAQHSVFCASIARERGLGIEEQRFMLLHDASEAYVGDVNRPLKSLLPNYQEIEANIFVAIGDRFGLEPMEPATVKAIDNEALAVEKNFLHPNSEDWPGMPVVEMPRAFAVLDPVASVMRFSIMMAELFPDENILGDATLH